MKVRARSANLGAPTAIADGARGVVTLTGPGTANTWGAWTQVLAALPYDVAGLYVNGIGASGGQTRPVQVGIGVGASSAEREIFRFFHPDHNFGLDRQFDLFVPLFVAKGERITLRGMTSNTNTGNMGAFSVVPIPPSPLFSEGFRGVEILGLSPSAALPSITVVPTNTGAAPERDGTQVEMSAAIAESWRALTVAHGGDGTLSGTAQAFYFRVRAGASGETVLQSPGIGQNVDRAQHAAPNFGLPPRPVSLAAGTRVTYEGIGSGAVPIYPILYGWY